jgi:hypothetical protein
MNLLNRMERRFGTWAIPNLTRWIIACNVIGYIAMVTTNGQIYQALCMDSAKVLQGEVWRLLTYLYLPPDIDAIWFFFALMFTYMIGEGLEEEWGAFRLNIYYLIGMIGTTAVAFITKGQVDNMYLNASLLLAFATIYPDYIIYLFFILPIKMKWLGWFTFSLLVAVPLLLGNWTFKLAAVVSIANYFLFFGTFIKAKAFELWGRRQSRARMESFQPDPISSFHRCKTCARTDASHPALIFRVSQDGEEYCTEHLPKKIQTA